MGGRREGRVRHRERENKTESRGTGVVRKKDEERKSAACREGGQEEGEEREGREARKGERDEC